MVDDEISVDIFGYVGRDGESDGVVYDTREISANYNAQKKRTHLSGTRGWGAPALHVRSLPDRATWPVRSLPKPAHCEQEA